MVRFQQSLSPTCWFLQDELLYFIIHACQMIKSVTYDIKEAWPERNLADSKLPWHSCRLNISLLFVCITAGSQQNQAWRGLWNPWNNKWRSMIKVSPDLTTVLSSGNAPRKMTHPIIDLYGICWLVVRRKAYCRSHVSRNEMHHQLRLRVFRLSKCNHLNFHSQYEYFSLNWSGVHVANAFASQMLFPWSRKPLLGPFTELHCDEHLLFEFQDGPDGSV